MSCIFAGVGVLGSCSHDARQFLSATPNVLKRAAAWGHLPDLDVRCSPKCCPKHFDRCRRVPCCNTVYHDGIVTFDFNSTRPFPEELRLRFGAPIGARICAGCAVRCSASHDHSALIALSAAATAHEDVAGAAPIAVQVAGEAAHGISVGSEEEMLVSEDSHSPPVVTDAPLMPHAVVSSSGLPGLPTTPQSSSHEHRPPLGDVSNTANGLSEAVRLWLMKCSSLVPAEVKPALAAESPLTVRQTQEALRMSPNEIIKAKRTRALEPIPLLRRPRGPKFKRKHEGVQVFLLHADAFLAEGDRSRASSYKVDVIRRPERRVVPRFYLHVSRKRLFPAYCNYVRARHLQGISFTTFLKYFPKNYRKFVPREGTCAPSFSAVLLIYS